MSLSEQWLSGFLGAPLQEGAFTYGLNCNGDRKVEFYPQAGLRMPVSVLRPGPTGCDPSSGTLIAVSDDGRSNLANDAIIQEANRRGWIVWMLDPRNIGEMAVPHDVFASTASLLLGEHLPWRQATDILRTLRRVGGSRYPTGLYARGKLMALAASYVAAIVGQNELGWTVLCDAAASFREMTDLPLRDVPFRGFQFFDIPDLWRAARAKVHLVRSPDEFIRSGW